MMTRSEPRRARQLQRLSPLGQLRAGKLPHRLTQLLVGLALYGITMGMMVQAGLGLPPWDVLHQGLAKLTGLSFGVVVIITSLIVLLLWVPLKQWPGLGTIANSVLIGVFADLTLHLLPAPDDLPSRIALLLAGVLGNGLAGALYIGSQLGPGPRDGLMTGLVFKTSRPVFVIRTALELAVLAVGFALGGSVGIGTLLYALGIGPIVGHTLPWAIVPLTTPGEATDQNET